MLAAITRPQEPPTKSPPLSAFFSYAFHRTPCDHPLTTARDHHCEAPRPELEVGGSGGRAVLPPSWGKPGSRWTSRNAVEHLTSLPSAPVLHRVELHFAAFRRLAVSRYTLVPIASSIHLIASAGSKIGD
uniref:Uncharacterized protein n=1 Tax=Oryza rufipogon TaxID=4529 RepID=A0A0E0QYH6_ORYRU